MRQREDRLRRVAEMGERLAALGVPIDVAPIPRRRRRAAAASAGPQIAAALLRAGHAATRDEAFDRFLGRRPRVRAAPRRSPGEVVGIIPDAGGIASLAHPGLAGATI